MLSVFFDWPERPLPSSVERTRLGCICAQMRNNQVYCTIAVGLLHRSHCLQEPMRVPTLSIPRLQNKRRSNNKQTLPSSSSPHLYRITSETDCHRCRHEWPQTAECTAGEQVVSRNHTEHQIDFPLTKKSMKLMAPDVLLAES
jgi:hypothetical protein